MAEFAAADPIIKTYLKDIQLLRDQHITHELGLKAPFHNLLDKAARRRGWWEAKDTSDKLAAEIQKKLKAGYPARNTIFEDTQVGVLYQDRSAKNPSA